MSEVWTIAEVRGGKLNEVSFELLTRGKLLADELGVKLATVVVGSGVEHEQLQQLIFRGSDILYVYDDARLSEFSCRTYAQVICHLIDEYAPEIVLAAATTMGRTLMPYVAVKAHVGLTADCTMLSIEKGTGNLLQTRPAIGGNILATIKTPSHRPQMATVRPKSSGIPHPDNNRKGEIKFLEFDQRWCDDTVEVLGLRVSEKQEVSIEEADIVVSGGRGLKKRDNFRLIEELAEDFGAQVGASRDAVDRGWASYPHQVGLSGKTISPRLYLACGISGAVQHLAGIKTAGCIVAINKDEHAHIVDLADFAVIGDLFSIIPEISRQLKGRKTHEA